MKIERVLILAIALLVLLSINIAPVLANMSSTNYQIGWDTLGTGGSDSASSATYKLRDNFGFIGGTSSSSSYQLDAGYRGGVYDQVAEFSVVFEQRSSAVAALSATPTSVTVTSTAGYMVGDYIVVIADEGSSQIAETGQITAINSPVITVDAFNGAGPVIDGSNDLVYRLTSDPVSLGTLNAAVMTTAIAAWSVTADVTGGYSVYIAEDHDLRNLDGQAINDVSDGTVSVGGDEYGARSSDATLAGSTFDTVDTALTDVLQQVASRSSNSFSNRDFLTLKIAPSVDQGAGSYSQTISLIYVGDY